MSRTKRSFWKDILEERGLKPRRNAYFGRFFLQFLRMSRTKRSFWKDILEERGLKPRRNAHFGRFFLQFLRMSRVKRSFWKISVSVFANVSYETLILEGLFVSFWECLARNAPFARSLCLFLRMSRTKRSF